ncbi:MAG: hypothetical protein GX066_00620 [Clostridiaceae bacterium]|nr:hypothetical protein [Clostridiaceae bacterium]
MEDKIKHLEEMLEQADLMVNELNNVSDYVATRVERENNSLLKTMDELKEKMKEVEKLKAGLNDQVVQCGHLIEQYKETINNMNNKYAINVEENLSKRIPLHPKYNEVMRLAEKGNSIKDIARELHIGQGEVKLLLGIKK